MSGDKGMEKSSEAESNPPGTSVPPEVSRAVFLSCASHDADTANSICQYLESHGVSCWLAPRDVTPGSQYADESVGAINDASLSADDRRGWIAGALAAALAAGSPSRLMLLVR